MDEAIFKKAVRQVLRDNSASVLNLREKLNISYQEARECIERMEQEKLIGPWRSPLERQIFMKAVPAKYR